MSDDAHDRLERIEQETPNAFELATGLLQFKDSSRLLALPAEMDEADVIALAEALPIVLGVPDCPFVIAH